jgi:pimeloyl-ACP methyl ester carboxylesterase
MGNSARGATPPLLAKEGYVDHEGARICYGKAGKGEPVILLHGGMESSLSWGNQAPALVKTHREGILIDSRGYGRSKQVNSSFLHN